MNITPETQALMQQIAEDAANRAVNRTLLTYGIDPEFPVEFQKDMAHLREWRRRMEKIEDKSLMVIITLFIGFVAAAVWLGIKTKIM